MRRRRCSPRTRIPSATSSGRKVRVGGSATREGRRGGRQRQDEGASRGSDRIDQGDRHGARRSTAIVLGIVTGDDGAADKMRVRIVRDDAPGLDEKDEHVLSISRLEVSPSNMLIDGVVLAPPSSEEEACEAREAQTDRSGRHRHRLGRAYKGRRVHRA